MVLVLKYWKELLALVLSVALGLGGFLYGVKTEGDHWRLKEATRIAQEARTKAQATTTALNLTAQHQEAVRALEEHYVQERNKYEAQINDLRRNVASGRVRVSAPGVCKASAPETARGVDAAGTCELQPGTAEALIHLSERADEVTMKLTALQEYVRTLGD